MKQLDRYILSGMVLIFLESLSSREKPMSLLQHYVELQTLLVLFVQLLSSLEVPTKVGH